MINGQKIVIAGLKHLGDTENPWASNTDHGGWIDEIQADWHLHAVPWCGCAWDRWYREAGIDDGGVGSPSTGAMCATARARGWVRRSGGVIPAGSAWIKCGTHVELVLADRGNGLVDNLGGNVNQAVRRTTRRVSDASMIIIPPIILEGEDEPVTVYGFQDLTLRPNRYGGWRTRAQREKVINEKLLPEQRKQVHRVNIGGTSPFAFVIYPRDNTRWQLGPWESKESRNALQREYKIAHPRHRLRPYALDVNSLAGTGGMTLGDIQT